MASCLGLYIEKNIIKYAKISKSNNAIKVESFGVKFYENLEKTIKQIVEETYSFKTPISINLTDEIYNQFEVFNMLSPKDVDSVIKTEFENICYDNGVNKTAYEQRYVLVNEGQKREKNKVIHVSAQKVSIEQKKNELKDYKVNSISPIGLTISNLIDTSKKQTVLVVNIEKNTTITKINQNGILDVSMLEFGSEEILEKIKQKENSYSKSYEICKNTTIYTEQDEDLQYEENEYLPDIMPTLFNIVSEVRKKTEESFENIEKVYITGTGSLINNIDLYFQEYLKSATCEILKPTFIKNNTKVNVKDYIEVNSAISVALQGLEKNNAINFTKESGLDKLVSLLKTDVTQSNINKKSIDEFLEKFDNQYRIFAITIILISLTYMFGSFALNKAMDKKMKNVNESISETENRINNLQEYNTKFNDQISNYERMIAKIENINNANSEDKRYKNTIPNLLNSVMAIIPKDVQLVSIENTTGTHVVIVASSTKYEQIAFFKTKLKTEEILKNVVSDTGTAEGGKLTVTIEGELP